MSSVDDAYTLAKWYSDPSSFFRAVTGLEPNEKQKELLMMLKNLSFRRILVCSARSTGKTLTLAVIALWLTIVLPFFIHMPMKVSILSGSFEQSKVLYDYVKSFLSSHPIILSQVAGEPTRKEVKFKNGGWIVALPASERTVLSKHCVLGDTFLMANSGLDRAKDIPPNEIGERMISMFSGRVVDIQVSKASPISLTSEHLIKIVRNPYKRRDWFLDRLGKRRLTEEWAEAGSVRKGDYLVSPVPVLVEKEQTLRLGRANRLSILDERISVTEEFSRLLGYYIGDGWLSGRGELNIIFNSEDGAWMEDCRLSIEHLKRKVREKDFGTYRVLTFSHMGLSKWISEEIGRKAWTKRIPTIILDSPRRMKEQFLVGYRRSDGYYNGSFSFSTVSKGLAEDVFLLMLNLGYLPSIKYRKVGGILSSMKLRVPNMYSAKHPSFIIGLHGTSSRMFSRISGDVPGRGRTWQEGFHLGDRVLMRVNGMNERRVENESVYDFKTDRGEFYAPYATIHNCDILMIDEAAEKHMLDGKLIKAAIPLISASRHPRAILSSTPYNYMSYFVDMWLNESTRFSDYQRVAWGTLDCPWISQDEYKEAERTLDTESFQINWEGKPVPLLGTMFNLEDIKKCRVDTEDPPVVGEGPITWGIDWGFEAPTVLHICQLEGDEWIVIHSVEWVRKRFETIHEDLEKLKSRFPPSVVYVDASHIGENQRLKDAGFPVKEVKFKSEKALMQGNLRMLIEKHRLRIWSHFITTITQLSRYTSETKKGDDFVDSLLLSVKGKASQHSDWTNLVRARPQTKGGGYSINRNTGRGSIRRIERRIIRRTRI